MSETQYVKVLRVTQDYFTPTRTRFFYFPIEVTVSRHGPAFLNYHGALFNEEDMPTVWGFETVEAAWEAIDIYRAEHCADEE